MDNVISKWISLLLIWFLCSKVAFGNWMYLGIVGVSIPNSSPPEQNLVPGFTNYRAEHPPPNFNYPEDHQTHLGSNLGGLGGGVGASAPFDGELGYTTNMGGEIQCSSVPGLVNKQRETCQAHPDAIRAVSAGARRGIMECQHQFRNERWNCTTEKDESVFGTTLSRGSRETAFIYAITSAGAVHAVTQACSAGNLTDCSCDLSKKGQGTVDGWKWGGCSDNVRFGNQFTKRFVDAADREQRKKKGDVRTMMNLHNNHAGRLAVAQRMELKCRCHGVSGSCELKTCWRTLPSFTQIGAYLKRKYEQSVQVSMKAKKRLRRRGKVKRKVPVRKEDLVHIHKSPNYCLEDPDNGILGTTGRKCNKTATGPESCNLLCCGRGYNTQVIRHIERCHCKFHWCCYVTCKVCETMVEVYTCK